MSRQKIKREEVVACPICQEQIEFKLELQIDIPEGVSVLGASINLPLVHKACALKERERSFEVAKKETKQIGTI